MARVKQTTIDGLALPVSAGGVLPLEADAPAFRIPLRRSLRMHPLLALNVALAVLVALLGFALTRKPVYRAESRVYVEPIPTRMLGDTGTGNYDMARYESFLQEQMETVARPDILLTAVNSMPAGVWQQPGEPAQAAAARLAAALKTERVSTSYQLAISVGAANPQTAAAAANAVTRAYLDAGQKDAKAVSAGRLQLLTEERQRITDEMQARRAEQNSLGASLGVANPNGAGADAYDTELQSVRGELASARQAHEVAAAQLAALSGPGGQHAAGTVALAEEAVASDPAISSMRIGINQRRATLMAQMNGMKPANPVYQEDQAELAKLDAQLAGMTTGMQAQVEGRMEAKLRQDLQRTGDIESRLNAEVSRDTALATSAGPKLQRSAELTADLARLQTRYAAVDDAVRGLQLETSGPGMAHLAVAASAPSVPEPSKSRLALYLALPLALLLGVASAIAAQKLDRHIYTPGEVEEALGFAPIGVLPVSSEVSEGVTDEYLLRLAAGMESAYRSVAARTFVFTAASAETEIGPEIAAVRRTLQKLGFSTAVVPAEQVMRPAGQIHHAQATAGGAESFALGRLEELKHTSNLLLIDALPLLHSAEAEYAVRSADAVILVVESGVTTQRELASAASLLRRLQASGVGTLLQGMSLRNAEPEFRESIAVLEKRELPGRIVRVKTAPVRAAAVVEESSPDQSGETSDPATEPELRSNPAIEVVSEVQAASQEVWSETAEAQREVELEPAPSIPVSAITEEPQPAVVEEPAQPEVVSEALPDAQPVSSSVQTEVEQSPERSIFARFLERVEGHERPMTRLSREAESPAAATVVEAAESMLIPSQESAATVMQADSAVILPDEQPAAVEAAYAEPEIAEAAMPAIVPEAEAAEATPEAAPESTVQPLPALEAEQGYLGEPDPASALSAQSESEPELVEVADQGLLEPVSTPLYADASPDLRPEQIAEHSSALEPEGEAVLASQEAELEIAASVRRPEVTPIDAWPPVVERIQPRRVTLAALDSNGSAHPTPANGVSGWHTAAGPRLAPKHWATSSSAGLEPAGEPAPVAEATPMPFLRTLERRPGAGRNGAPEPAAAPVPIRPGAPKAWQVRDEAIHPERSAADRAQPVRMPASPWVSRNGYTPAWQDEDERLIAVPGSRSGQRG